MTDTHKLPTVLPSGIVALIEYRYDNPLYLGIYDEVLARLNEAHRSYSGVPDGLNFFDVMVPPTFVGVQLLMDTYLNAALFISKKDFEVLQEAIQSLPLLRVTAEEVRELADEYCQYEY